MTHVGVQSCEEWFEGHKISKINKARLHTPIRRRCNLPPAAGGGRSNDNHNTRGCLPQTIAHTEGVCPPCTRNYDSTTQPCRPVALTIRPLAFDQIFFGVADRAPCARLGIAMPARARSALPLRCDRCRSPRIRDGAMHRGPRCSVGDRQLALVSSCSARRPGTRLRRARHRPDTPDRVVPARSSSGHLCLGSPVRRQRKGLPLHRSRA